MSRLPALPPATGCRVCGTEHFELCESCADSIGVPPRLIPSPTCLKCGQDRRGFGSAHYCTACLSDGKAAPMSLEEQTQLSEEMDRDNDRQVAIRFGFRVAA